MEYKEEYDRLKKEQDRAIDDSAHRFNKKRGITAEIKQYQKQKDEAENFEKLARQRRDVVVEYLLWKLYHVEQKSNSLEKEASERRLAADDATEDQVRHIHFLFTLLLLLFEKKKEDRGKEIQYQLLTCCLSL